MGRKEYRTRQIALFSVLSVCVTAIIFWNSLQNAQQSNALSGGVLAAVKPVLSPLFGGSEEAMDRFVRKSAHFTEFAVLGLCLGAVADGICVHFWRTSLAFFPMFATLSIAVTDEFIQSFSDRTSAVKDVILDFCGGLFGLTVIIFVLAALPSRRKSKEEKA